MKAYRRILPREIEDAIDSYIRNKEDLLSDDATRSEDALRRYNAKSKDIRAPFSRDADRIIHTRAYARYIDKTQVFYLVENDHITHRVLHVQLVSKIARTIGRSLRLNEDLIEAIALGHDIGHIPYGHIGEECLSRICSMHHIGGFHHNVQSVRSLQEIEDRDLTLQVLDGILCHNGEAYDNVLIPDRRCDWNIFDQKMERANETGETPPPMSREGCVVRAADTIAYISRDLEDAIEVNLIAGFFELPDEVREVLGDDHPMIIDTLIKDLIQSTLSQGSDAVSYSDEVDSALQILKKFNYEHIYFNPRLAAQKPKIQNMYACVYEELLEDVKMQKRRSSIFRDFIEAKWINPKYVERSSEPELVRDYIAGMTDRYFEKVFKERVLPQKTDSRFFDAS
jgi:dGTPase